MGSAISPGHCVSGKKWCCVWRICSASMRYINQYLIIGLFYLILLHKSVRTSVLKSPENTHSKWKNIGLLSSKFPKTIFSLDILVSSKLNVTWVFEIPRNEYLISFLFLHEQNWIQMFTFCSHFMISTGCVLVSPVCNSYFNFLMCSFFSSVPKFQVKE